MFERRTPWLLALVAAATLGPPARLHAQTVPTTFAFAYVDSYRIDVAQYASGAWTRTVHITGVLVGARAPITIDLGSFTPSTAPVGAMELEARCERLALMAMARPGAYVFTIGADPPGTPYPVTFMTACALSRVP